jgi:hypothetical protein
MSVFPNRYFSLLTFLLAAFHASSADANCPILNGTYVSHDGIRVKFVPYIDPQTITLLAYQVKFSENHPQLTTLKTSHSEVVINSAHGSHLQYGVSQYFVSGLGTLTIHDSRDPSYLHHFAFDNTCENLFLTSSTRPVPIAFRRIPEVSMPHSQPVAPTTLNLPPRAPTPTPVSTVMPTPIPATTATTAELVPAEEPISFQDETNLYSQKRKRVRKSRRKNQYPDDGTGLQQVNQKPRKQRPWNDSINTFIRKEPNSDQQDPHAKQ